MSWTVRAVSVRAVGGGGIRWTVRASRNGTEMAVYVETSSSGTIVDLQTDSRSGTTGDVTLDNEIAGLLERLLQHYELMRGLDRAKAGRRRGSG